MNITENISNKIFPNKVQQYTKRTIYMTKWGISQKYKDSSTFKNQSI